jgi:hypothetical protein
MADENLDLYDDDIWWQSIGQEELNKLQHGDPIKFDFNGHTFAARIDYVGHTYIGVSGLLYSSSIQNEKLIPRVSISNLYSTHECDTDLGI